MVHHQQTYSPRFRILCYPYSHQRVHHKQHHISKSESPIKAWYYIISHTYSGERGVQCTRGWHYIGAYTSIHDRGQDLDPSNFYAWLLDHTENLTLTLDYPALTTPIERLERLWPFLSYPRFLAWPFDQLRTFTLTALTPVAGGSTVVYVVSPPPPV